MVYKRYYSPFGGDVRPQSLPQKSDSFKEEKPAPIVGKGTGFLKNIAFDDLILIGILIILLSEAKDDRDIPLILAIGYLFLIEYIER